MIADMLRALGLSLLVLGSAGMLPAAAPAADGGGTSVHAGHVMTPVPAPVEEPAATHADHTKATTTKATNGHVHEAPATPPDHDAAQPTAHDDHEAAPKHDGGRVAVTPSRETRQAVVAGFFLVNAAILLTALAVGLRNPRRRRRLA
jgi:hypothetical protein